MYKFLNEILVSSREIFARKSTFKWFVILVVGLMIRQDHLGVTSIIRVLDLSPHWYETMLHFFRSTAWNIEMVTKWWTQAVANHGGLFLENGMPILVGDGVKQGKEGKKMPCVKRLHQESDTVSKATYF